MSKEPVEAVTMVGVAVGPAVGVSVNVEVGVMYLNKIPRLPLIKLRKTEELFVSILRIVIVLKLTKEKVF